MLKNLLFVFIVASTISQAYSFKLLKSTEKENSSKFSTREMILGGILKGALESMHFSKLKIDNNLSSKALR